MDSKTSMKAIVSLSMPLACKVKLRVLKLIYLNEGEWLGIIRSDCLKIMVSIIHEPVESV